MGRRSTHTADELRELILTSARDIIEKDGLAGLSARTIARRIGYSPGTLYNVFDNIDELVLHVEARLLKDLDDALTSIPRNGDPQAHLREIAQVYLTFTQQRPRLWNLLFEHHLPASFTVPEWYRLHLDRLLSVVESAISDVTPHVGEDVTRRAARVLWAGVHGITSLATADKLSSISKEHASVLIDDLVSHYVVGLKDRLPAT